MERKYYRQYENYPKIIPKQEDFPVIEFSQESKGEKEINVEKEIALNKSSTLNFKLDDIIILVLLVMLLSENEKDSVTVLILAFLFLSEYIF